MNKYLGLDLSTQGLTATAIDCDLASIDFCESVNFGKDLPEYESPNGFIARDAEVYKQYHANPIMWLEALDLLFSRIVAKGYDLSLISGISGCAQQHATVYLNANFKKALNMSGSGNLCDIFKDSFSRSVSPIWLDTNTSLECAQMAASVGGDFVARKKTGSPMTERFSAAQIRKFFKTDNAKYNATDVIHLASSFLCSVLCGHSVPIDYGDGAGMNLFNLDSLEADSDMISACADGLAPKLPPFAPSKTICGTLSPYYKKYGFNEVPIMLFSGDNPSSLVGMGASENGAAVISLGTSDTYFATSAQYVSNNNACGHVFGNPMGGFMSLFCFRNGSLARDFVRQKLSMTWSQFDCTYLNSQIGSETILPFIFDEITPKSKAVNIEIPANSCREKSDFVNLFLQSQFLNMRCQTQELGTPKKILLTGGASKSEGIGHLIADIFGCGVERISISNSASLGGAMRIANRSFSMAKLADMFCKSKDCATIMPNDKKKALFDDKLRLYAEKLKEFIKR